MPKHPFILVFLIAVVIGNVAFASSISDRNQLEMAIDYFQGGKYHEALLLFRKLDASYTLNKRMRAFMGVCYFYEKRFAESANILDSLSADICKFAPGERLVYYKCCAESHYNLGQYRKSIDLYERGLSICEGNERGYIYHKLAFCWFQMNDIPKMQDCLNNAAALYRANNNSSQLLQMDQDIKTLFKAYESK